VPPDPLAAIGGRGPTSKGKGGKGRLKDGKERDCLLIYLTSGYGRDYFCSKIYRNHTSDACLHIHWHFVDACMYSLQCVVALVTVG